MSETESIRRIVGRRIATARRTAHLTQAEVAKRSGLSIRTLAMVEQGTTAASIDTLEAIASALSLPIGYMMLLNEEDFALLAVFATLSPSDRLRMIAIAQAVFGPI